MKREEAASQDKTRLTLHLRTLHAVENPELAGKAEWELRLWINGLERWRSDHHFSVGEGETVAIDQMIATDLAPWTDTVKVEVRAKELDRLNPDDHASGETTLTRVQGFSEHSGFTLSATGEGAHIDLRFDVEVKELA